jgi:hypothetical protein
MNKKVIIIFLTVFLIALCVSAEYLVLKDGKKLKITGTYKIENQLVIFKVPGSDLDISLPLEKVDLEKTKALNTVKVTGKENKKVKIYTNKDIKGEDRVISTTEGTDEGAESTTSGQIPVVQVLPSYSVEELNAKENDWWTEEIGRVQQMLQEAYKQNRKAIGEYNDLVMDFNTRNDAERRVMKPRMDAKSEAIKQSKQLVKSWYSAIQQLYDAGQEIGKEAWLLKPLADTLEANKDAVE